MYIVINVIKAYACESLVKNTFGQTQFFSSQICHTWINFFRIFNFRNYDYQTKQFSPIGIAHLTLSKNVQSKNNDSVLYAYIY